MRYCGVCGHNVREWGAHLASAEHRRKMHPAGSRKGTKADARRARAKGARHHLTRRHERDMWDAEEAWMRGESRRTGRHYYGAWSPWGVSAFMGGGPGRGRGRTGKKQRAHLKRLRDLGEQ